MPGVPVWIDGRGWRGLGGWTNRSEEVNEKSPGGRPVNGDKLMSQQRTRIELVIEKKLAMTKERKTSVVRSTSSTRRRVGANCEFKIDINSPYIVGSPTIPLSRLLH